MSITTQSRTVALSVVLAFASTGYAQTRLAQPGPNTPDFRVQIWGNIEADFTSLVTNYFEMRGRLEEGLPPLTVTDNVAEIRTAERTLAARIQAARGAARQGEIFTPAIAAAFRKALAAQMNDLILAVILDDNPGRFTHRINRNYPKTRAMSTVPGIILGAMPRLPDDIQYRFLGRDLILHDTRSNTIVDRLPCAITCTD